MVAVRLEVFGGMLPALDDELLPPHGASHSENTWLYQGKLGALPQPKLLHTASVVSSLKFAYRIPNSDTFDAQHLDDSTWMEFEDPYTNVIRSPVVGDTDGRYYWASSAIPPKYNTLARIQNGDPAYLLGIPQPGNITVVSSGGGAGVDTSIAYVVTFVSAYGEEGPPCDPELINCKNDETITITLPTAAADDQDGPDRDLDFMNIYRTVTSSNGVATYFYVAQVAITATTYDDDLSTNTDAIISLNDILPSTNWQAPPSDLVGIIQLGNGVVAGWRDNEVWFSEPYRPHAWPPAYAVALDFPVIGMGVVSSTAVACTAGNPFAISGAHPASYSVSKLGQFEPCLAREGIVSTPGGVYYPSQNGLILVANGTATNVTRRLIEKDKWLELAVIGSLHAARINNAYYCFGSTTAGFMQADAFQTDMVQSEDFSGAYGGLLIDPTHERVAYNLLSADDATDHVYNDPWSGEIFVVRNNSVYWLDLSDPDQDVESYLWKSKVLRLQEKKNIAAAKVYFETYPSTPAQSLTRNNDLVQTLAADQYGLFRFYGDGTLIATRELRTSGELFRLPSGLLYETVQIEIEARVKILNVQIASTVKELTRV